MNITIRDATLQDMPAVLAIYNHEVLHSTATYQYTLRTLAEQEEGFAARSTPPYAFLVAQDATGTLLGFASYGLYRPREGWRFACEHSVYTHKDYRGRGVARTLMQPLLARARAGGLRTMVGVVDASNEASVKLHQSLGFSLMGVHKNGGYKFDRWLDVAFVVAQLDE
ncbi:MAG: GNAT family N-acetyltransferase [Burkholderiaceae bacterium]